MKFKMSGFNDQNDDNTSGLVQFFLKYQNVLFVGFKPFYFFEHDEGILLIFFLTRTQFQTRVFTALSPGKVEEEKYAT